MEKEDKEDKDEVPRRYQCKEATNRHGNSGCSADVSLSLATQRQKETHQAHQSKAADVDHGDEKKTAFRRQHAATAVQPFAPRCCPTFSPESGSKNSAPRFCSILAGKPGSQWAIRLGGAAFKKTT